MNTWLNGMKKQIAEVLTENSRTNLLAARQYFYPLAMATYDEDEIAEALDSMCRFRTTMWEKTAEFESQFSDQFGGESVMVNSGSSADLLIAFSLHENSGGPLKSEDEVLVPAVTWPTQVWSLLMAGFIPRFVDCDPQTLNVSIPHLTQAINEKTKAISLVHLMGNTADIESIEVLCRKFGLLLIEDCCEALGTTHNGRKVGTFGRAGAFSFFFSHHITTMEGGMITTKDSDLADQFRLLRAHGWSRNLKTPRTSAAAVDSRYTFLTWGFNVRPTELQAGFGLAQLRKYPVFKESRQRNADRLLAAVSPFRDFIRPMEVSLSTACSWFAFPILTNSKTERDSLVAYLELNGVETRPIVAGNLARQPASQQFASLAVEKLEGADRIHNNGFYVGIHPVDMTDTISRFEELLVAYF